MKTACWALFYVLSAVSTSCAVQGYIPDDCFLDTPQGRMMEGTTRCMQGFEKIRVDGLWLIGFEQSYFIATGESDVKKFDLANDGIWIEVDKKHFRRILNLEKNSPGVYRASLVVKYRKVLGFYGSRGGAKFGALLVEPIHLTKID